MTVNRRTGHVVDGHLRIELALTRKEPSVPVTYVDLSEDEERLVLASLDSLAAMAEAEVSKLAELLEGHEPGLPARAIKVLGHAGRARFGDAQPWKQHGEESW